MEKKHSETKMFILLFLCLAALYLVALGHWGLLDPDEGRYAEIPRDMLERGDFVTPKLNYVDYFEKPILHYWATALSLKVFGLKEFAARLFPALSALCGLILTYILGRKMLDEKAGLLAGAILGTNLLYFVIGQINIIDMPLTFFLTLSITGLWFGIRYERRTFAIFYLGMALALLTKGLIGVVLPGGILFWWIVLTRRWDVIKKSLYLPGIMLFFLIAAPWFVAVSIKNPDFPYFFFVREHFLRYTTKIHGRYEPWWWFIPILLVGFIPWAGFLPKALAKAMPRTLKNMQPLDEDKLFLLLWFLVIFVFFSLSDSKLIPYIVPVFPPLALLSSHHIMYSSFQEKGRKNKLPGLFINIGAALLFGLALIAYPFFDEHYGPAVLLPYSLPPAIALIGYGIFSIFSYLRGSKKALLAGMVAFAFLFTAAFKPIFGFYGQIMSSKHLATVLEKVLSPTDLVAQYRTYDHSLSFYLKRRIALVDYLGELEYGAKKAKDDDWFLDMGSFINKYWNTDKRVILIMRAGEKIKLPQRSKNPITIYRDDRRVVLANQE